MLRVEGVTKRYGGVTALDGVSLSVDAGEIVALLGANGAGKTTLLSLASGLRRPDQGVVAIGPRSEDPRTPATRRQIGFAPQELGVYPTITVASNLRFFAEVGGLRRAEAAARIDEVAAELGITDLLGRQAGGLSGGERRRVHVAMALVHRPGLVILDEPTAGVDVAARAGLVEMVRAIAKGGAAVVYSTHYLAEAEAFGGRVAVLHRGAKVADATVASLIAGLPGRVELSFDGPAPTLPSIAGSAVETDGDLVTVVTADPEHHAATILADAASALHRLRTIRVRPAALEDAYTALTGEVLEEGAP